jgi:hypothetical protein
MKSLEEFSVINKFIIISILLILSLLYFFNDFVFSKLIKIAGDRGDGRFIVVTLEHWYHYFRGFTAWHSPLFFWPEERVLGYSDGLFLMALPYSIFRLLGADLFLSMELSLVIFRAIGFIFFFLLLWRIQCIIGWLSLFGAILFTILNSHYVSTIHPQLLSVSLLPFIAYLFIKPLLSNKRPHKLSLLITIWISGLLFSITFLTAYYIAWFFSFILIIYAISYFVFKKTRFGLDTTIKQILSVLKTKYMLIISFMIGMIIGILPATWLYLKTLKNIGHRSLGRALSYAPIPIDLVNIGSTNLFWGWMVDTIEPMSAQHELSYGITPVLLFIFLFSIIYSLIRARKIPFIDESILAAGTVVIVLWIVIIKVGPISAWGIVYYLIPGAKAIAAIGRVNIILSNFIVIAVIGFFNRILKYNLINVKSRKSGIILITICCVLILTEQINTGTVHWIDRSEEKKYLSNVPSIPINCKAFYVTKPFKIKSTWYEYQLDAALVAVTRNIPTINGYSGNLPKKWDLINPKSPLYRFSVYQWIMGNGIDSGIYSLDGQSYSWRKENINIKGEKIKVPLSEKTPHQIGLFKEEKIRSGLGESGYLVYGPYIHIAVPGIYYAIFDINISAPDTFNDSCGYVDIYSNSEGIINKKLLYSGHQRVKLQFDIKQINWDNLYEFRIFSNGNAIFIVKEIYFYQQ